MIRELGSLNYYPNKSISNSRNVDVVKNQRQGQTFKYLNYKEGLINLLFEGCKS